MAGTVSFHPVKLFFGALCDEIFNQQEVCLVTYQNSVSLKNFGMTADVVRKYKYGDIAGHRYACQDIQQYARQEDRSRVGSVHVKSPPLYSEGPLIATLILQYGIGLPIEDNTFSKKQMKKFPDSSVARSLEKDTSEERRVYFNRSVFQLGQELGKSEYENIKKIVIPAGIGRRGLDDVWLCVYARIIAAFARDMAARGKEVVLLIQESYLRHIESAFENRNVSGDDVSLCFEAIRNLTVLSKEDLSLDITLPYNGGGDEDDDDDDDDDGSISRYIIA